MSTPVWVTPPGTLGTIPEGVFYSTPLVAVADETVYYQVIAGQLPPGIFIDETGILSGLPQSVATAQGIPLPVASDITSKFAVRAFTASRQLADRTFTITVTGQNQVAWSTPAGLIATYYDGNQVSDLQVQYSNPDIYVTEVVTLVGGQLPPGLTISSTGVISGYIIPNIPPGQTPGYSVPGEGYSQYPYDFTTNSTSTNYQFTLKVTNGQSSDIRTFSIYVYALSTMTADNTYLTADNTFVTADVSPLIPPIITTPTGSIGTVRSDNFFAFQFTGIDFNYNQFRFITTTSLPPGLTLDPNSGWLYGYIPAGGINITTYPFVIRAQEINEPDVISVPYDYTLTIEGPVSSDIVWLTPSDLGIIDNGATSTLYVEAVNVSGLPLTYQLLSGSDSRLPQGLQLLPSGHIAGRVSFDTFALDEGTTTFDATTHTNTTAIPQPTTFDMTCTFTVNATSNNSLVNVNKTFSIRVVRRYNEPYDNLYIQAMPPQNDRDLIASLVQNKTIFPPALIYRNDDPNFGVASRVIYEHAYGLTAATYDDYVASLTLNHYWKNLLLGEIKTAQALDDAGNVLYEVVYSEVIDNLVNNAGESVGKSVNLPFVIPVDTQTVYPNALVDMRTQVIDTVGQVSNVLPRWMLSKQANGRVLGFTPAWVIAYTNPGQSGQIAYNIKTQFGNQLDLVDFEVDRYELDNLLTKNWDRAGQHWIPQPPSYTRFDCGSANYQVDPWIVEPTYYYTIHECVGNGASVTVTLKEPANPPITIGQNLLISGIQPIGFNGPVTVTSCTDSSFTYNSTVLGKGVGGQAITLPQQAHWVNNADDLVQWTNSYNNQPTVFDGNSLQFTAPVDMYSNSNEYDKYLVFPKRNILR
jgi:hypothetical protein